MCYTVVVTPYNLTTTPQGRNNNGRLKGSISSKLYRSFDDDFPTKIST